MRPVRSDIETARLLVAVLPPGRLRQRYERIVEENLRSQSPPHLGALWGVVCSDDLPMYVVEDGDGTRWLVSDLTDWYLNGRADRILREEA